MNPPEVILSCKLLQPIIDIKQLIQSKTRRWAFSRPYYDVEKYVWEIYITLNPELSPGQQKLEDSE